MYNIEVRLADKSGWHTPQEARAYYGRYSRSGITIHWWNSRDKIGRGQHDNIVNYILGKARAGSGSVNYVVSDHKITMLVRPENVAWASQAGNPTTISIEIDPWISDEGYRKVGWLISELEKQFSKKLTLVKHSKWFTTQCPGDLSLTKMRKEADSYSKNDVKLTWTRWSEGPQKYQAVDPGGVTLWRFDKASWAGFNDPGSKIKVIDKKHVITIVGEVINHNLGGAKYLLTEYSFSKKIPTGFNAVDLDIYTKPEPEIKEIVEVDEGIDIQVIDVPDIQEIDLELDNTTGSFSVDSISENTVDDVINKGKEEEVEIERDALIEAIKEILRVGFLAGISAILTGLTTYLAGMDPSSTVVVIGTLVLRFIDKLIHESDNINLNGISPI